MKRALFVSVPMLSAIAFTVVSGQTDRHDSPGSVTFAVGSSANQIKDGSKFNAPGMAQIGFEKGFEGSLFSLRVETNGYQNFYEGLTSSNRVRSVGLSLMPVYSFSTGPTRPYVLGGIGSDRFSARSYYQGLNTPNGAVPNYSRLVQGNAASFSIGGGLLRRVGEGWYYAEVRGEVFTGAGAFSHFRVPVTFGMRF